MRETNAVGADGIVHRFTTADLSVMEYYLSLYTGYFPLLGIIIPVFKPKVSNTVNNYGLWLITTPYIVKFSRKS